MKTDPKKQLKLMAVLCAALGPMLVFMSLVGFAAQSLLRYAKAKGYSQTLHSTLNDMAIDFSVRSSVITIPLGFLLLAAGLQALIKPAKARVTLLWTAWLTTAAMIGLGVMWSLAVSAVGLGLMEHVGGWVGHGVQAVLAAGTARWLGREDVKAACD